MIVPTTKPLLLRKMLRQTCLFSRDITSPSTRGVASKIHRFSPARHRGNRHDLFIPSNGFSHMHQDPLSNLVDPPNKPSIQAQAGTSKLFEEARPKRPLTAYNIFFQNERKRILESLPSREEGKPRNSHGKIGFKELARFVASRWRNLSDQELAPFQDAAKQDKKRYARAMKDWRIQVEAFEKQRHLELNAERRAEQCKKKSSPALFPNDWDWDWDTCAKRCEKPSSPTLFPDDWDTYTESSPRDFETFFQYQSVNSDALDAQATASVAQTPLPYSAETNLVYENKTYGPQAMAELASKLDDDAMDLFIATFR